MDRDEYTSAFRKLRRSKNLRDVKIPEDVFEFGWKIAQFKPKIWVTERISYWLYAYDKSHKWTKQDFFYEINDDAYAKAKAKRKERRTQAQESALRRHNRPKPIPEVETDWKDCSGAPQAFTDMGTKDSN